MLALDPLKSFVTAQSRKEIYSNHLNSPGLSNNRFSSWFASLSRSKLNFYAVLGQLI